MFEIKDENGVISLFYNGEKQFKKEGDFSIEEMIERLHGYLLSGLTEIPEEITYAENHSASQEEINELKEVLEKTKQVLADIKIYQEDN